MNIAKGTIIYLYLLKIKLLNTFTFIKITVRFLNSIETTISKYLKSHAIFRNEFILSLVPLKKIFNLLVILIILVKT